MKKKILYLFIFNINFNKIYNHIKTIPVEKTYENKPILHEHQYVGFEMCHNTSYDVLKTYYSSILKKTSNPKESFYKKISFFSVFDLKVAFENEFHDRDNVIKGIGFLSIRLPALLNELFSLSEDEDMPKEIPKEKKISSFLVRFLQDYLGYLQTFPSEDFLETDESKSEKISDYNLFELFLEILITFCLQNENAGQNFRGITEEILSKEVENVLREENIHLDEKKIESTIKLFMEKKQILESQYDIFLKKTYLKKKDFFVKII